MKRIYSIFAVLLLAAAITSCRRCQKCADICTDELRMIMVQVTKASGGSVAPDEVYTIRTDTGERIDYPANSSADARSSYVVLDDSYHARMRDRSLNFRFVIRKAGQTIVDEPYEIYSDGCHINKRSGRDAIQVP